MSEVVVGCCGWTEAQAKYIRKFDSIELQTTFYQPPGDAAARRWKSQAPSGFRFCMKAWQLITHTPASPTFRRLRSRVSPSEINLYGNFRSTEQVALAWQRTREIADIVDAQVIIFQCPASFLPTHENIRNFHTFFKHIERRNRVFAWEPRGEEWDDQLVFRLCADNQLVHCVDPFVRKSVYGDSLYWRLHGRDGYRYRYTESDLAEMNAQLKTHSQLTGPNYVMFNNVSSREDALRFLDHRSGAADTKSDPSP